MAEALNKRRVNGKMCVLLPANASFVYVTVVNKYKHLGSITSVDNCDMYEIQHRCSEAIGVYAPLSGHIFCSRAIGVWLK